LKEIVLGKNVFVVLPTGSGKSLIFQAAPLVFDLVISPLVSLMKYQVNFLSSKGITVDFTQLWPLRLRSSITIFADFTVNWLGSVNRE